ncbi:hypothetical protein FRC07_003313 [Ceratobasidium sp. 392]|nr:hypothetical protein FRC07_003313 [Ceratobasidium sp. 392]
MWTQDISDLGRDDLSDTVPIALEYLSQLSIPEIERNHRKFLRVMAKLPPNVHARKIRPEQFVRRGDVEIFEPRGLMAKLLRY